VVASASAAELTDLRYFDQPLGEDTMAKDKRRGNREQKKPKKDKPKAIAAAPSTKGFQPEAAIARSKKR
jgi:hypothetical protein